MARTVFFSFHYQRDIPRVEIVKRHYVTKGTNSAAGYFNGSLEEKSKTDGDDAVARLIDNGLSGSSVLCVLIGNQTYSRRWVHYEIFKAIERGMGVLGIRIHQIPHFQQSTNPSGGRDTVGTNPFSTLGYGRKDGKLSPMIQTNSVWNPAPRQSLITESTAPYLSNVNRPILSSLFKTYDWVDHDGYNNFDTWVEAAAKQAGK